MATYITRGEVETMAVARELAERLSPGAVVLLHGDLGAGKTVFVRGLAEGLGVRPEDVSSPSFTLIQEYAGTTPLYHVDLYRLTPADAEDLGLEELMVGNGVVAIEWADRLPRAVEDGVVVRIEAAGETRAISIIPGGSSALPS